MTRKQMKKTARTLYECELVHSDPEASKEAKRDAEIQIMQITNQVMSQKDGINTLLEIDTLMQEMLFKGE